MGRSVNPLVYNGDIIRPEDAWEVCNLAGTDREPDSSRMVAEERPPLAALMIGRGLLTDPSLVRRCQGGPAMNVKELRDFHDDLYESLGSALPRKKVLLGQMKGYWYYLGQLFAGCEEGLARIRRADSEQAYQRAVRELLAGKGE